MGIECSMGSMLAMTGPGGPPFSDLSAPTPPGPQRLGATATTASATWTHAGAPAGTTYAVSVVGTDESTPTATGSGLGEWTWPATSGVSYAATIVATGTDGQTAQSSALVQVQPDIATDFPVEGAAGWRTVFASDLTAESAQGPLAAGAGTVSIGGETVPYLGNATTGTFGTNNQTVIGANGLVTELLTTSGQLIQCALDLPLGETITSENGVRVRVKLRAYCGDSSDSVFIYLSDPSIDPDNSESSSARTGGIRLMGTFANLYARRGGAASTAIPVATEWTDGSTPLYLTLIAPGYGNDVTALLSATSFTAAPDFRMRTNSRASNPELDTAGSAFFVGDWSSVKVLFAVANGSAGSTLPSLSIESLSVEVR